MDGKNKTRTENARIQPLTKPPRTTADQPTYCQVVRPVTFQDKNLNFLLTALSIGGAGTSPLYSTSVAQVNPELTNTTTAAPDYATPMALEG